MDIINEHETIYSHLRVIKAIEDIAMEQFESVTANDIRTLQAMMLNHVKDLLRLLGG